MQIIRVMQRSKTHITKTKKIETKYLNFCDEQLIDKIPELMVRIVGAFNNAGVPFFKKDTPKQSVYGREKN